MDWEVLDKQGQPLSPKDWITPGAPLWFFAQWAVWGRRHGTWDMGHGIVLHSPRGPTCLGLGVVVAAEGLQLAGAVVGGAGEAPAPLSAVPLDQACRTRRDLRGAMGAPSDGTPKLAAWNRQGQQRGTRVAWLSHPPQISLLLLDPITAPSLPDPITPSQIPLLAHPFWIPSPPLDPIASSVPVPGAARKTLGRV